MKIKTALISVYNKDKLNNILKELKKYKIKIISSGGTYKKIKSLGYKCIEISNYTEFTEITHLQNLRITYCLRICYVLLV